MEQADPSGARTRLPQHGPAPLRGRQRECEVLDRLVDDVLAERSRVLVLRGEAGVGKTALLEHVSARAAGWRELRAAGVESEMELTHSALHQLCAPLLDRLGGLPAAQREALATVFGLSAGPPPDRGRVGLAVLTLLADAAEEEPLLCIVDDAQWLDRASAQILAVVARRLGAERIALVCAARPGEGDEDLRGLPELAVTGIADDVARALLLDNVHGPLDAAVCDQIVAECHGNPLALVELPRTWSAAGLAGGFGILDDRSVPGKVEESYGRRLADLPAATRLLVLAAAAEPLGDPEVLRRAASALAVAMPALAPAVDAGFLDVGSRVEFAHPLVRSAAYRTASTTDRRRVHRALAEATDPGTDPDRRAWHRARAALRPDEDVAAELERSAGRAQARGGVAAAAAFLTRAAELTPSPAERVRRTLDAAFASVRAGAFDTARSLLALARSGPLGPGDHVRVDLLGAHIALASSPGAAATPLLVATASRLEALDARLARETYLDAFAAAHFGARLNERAGVSTVARVARDAARPPGEPTVVDLLLDAYVALDAAGAADAAEARDAAAVEACRRALARVCGDALTAEERLRWAWHGIVMALELWDDERASVLSRQYLELARATGALGELGRALTSAPSILIFGGELEEAADLVAEEASLRELTRAETAPYPALKLLAWRGQEREARALIDATTRDAGARGEGIAVATAAYAGAVLGNGLGDYETALAAASLATEHRELVLENWGLVELVEAASRTGRTALAAEALDRLSRKAAASGTAWALGMAARSRAVLAGDAAEDHFREAVELLSRTRVRTELARAHLLYGEWLRRGHRRVDARRELGLAHELFLAIGMGAFARRAAREVAATGATVRERNVETRDELTAQEALIARLARAGLSNPEIGAQLFISARTVEWHLRKVFAKLGIRSRADLHAALADS